MPSPDQGIKVLIDGRRIHFEMQEWLYFRELYALRRPIGTQELLNRVYPMGQSSVETLRHRFWSIRNKLFGTRFELRRFKGSQLYQLVRLPA